MLWESCGDENVPELAMAVLECPRFSFFPKSLSDKGLGMRGGTVVVSAYISTTYVDYVLLKNVC